MNSGSASNSHRAAEQKSPPNLPRQIEGYRIEKLLGEDEFKHVYLARDKKGKDNRWVVLRVARRDSFLSLQSLAAYLTEARGALSLHHPNIVSLYDIESTEEFPCVAVSQHIDGESLAQRLEVNQFSPKEAAQLIITAADALHYAHRRGLVHRGIKPANILFDLKETLFVAELGLVPKQEEQKSGFGGRGPYFSPEQARGEEHRVDARSDIFGLGAVFYQLLTGNLPFHGNSEEQILEQIRLAEPSPPRQLNNRIPGELERICMKALSKRVVERYGTAKDLADDLRHWIAPVLTKEIFLSHASPDKPMADSLCRLIEEEGVGCWIAPRDILPGDDYGESIIRAIEQTSVTVLLLSSHSNSSVHVVHEVERATSKRKRVVPVRLEDVLPDKSLELHLSTAQWLDSYREGLNEVALRIVQIVKGASAQAPTVSRLPSRSEIRSGETHHIVPKGLRSFDAHDADFFWTSCRAHVIGTDCRTTSGFGRRASRKPMETARFR